MSESEPKPIWEDRYEGEPLPIVFKARQELEEAFDPEEQAAIRALGLGFVITDELWPKVQDILWSL
jgi:hypothetical protein